MNPGKAMPLIITASLKMVISFVCTTRRASILPPKVISTGRTRYTTVTPKVTTVFTGENPNWASLNSTDQRKIISCGPTTRPTREVQSGTAVVISIEVKGDDLKYQWYIGKPGDTSKPIAGSTSNTLEYRPSNESTNFWVQITTKAGVYINSDTSVITVIAPSNHSGPLKHLDGTAEKRDAGPNGNVFGPIFTQCRRRRTFRGV